MGMVCHLCRLVTVTAAEDGSMFYLLDIKTNEAIMKNGSSAIECELMAV